MRNFIILTDCDGFLVSLDINDIVIMEEKSEGFGRQYTTIVYGTDNNHVIVKESIEEIVKRINEININNKK